MALYDTYGKASSALRQSKQEVTSVAAVDPPTPEPKGPKPKAKGTFNRTVYQRDLMRVRRKQARARGKA